MIFVKDPTGHRMATYADKPALPWRRQCYSAELLAYWREIKQPVRSIRLLPADGRKTGG